MGAQAKLSAGGVSTRAGGGPLILVSGAVPRSSRPYRDGRGLGGMWGQTGRYPLLPKGAPPEFFLLQLPNPLLQELPLWFLLGQRQGFLISGPSLGCPAEPAVHICAG